MIRQIRRLTRPFPAAGPGALAVAIYAEADGSGHRVRAAAEQGFEGVACLDDVARAAGLYSIIWRRHRFKWARDAAEGLLLFVMYMQEDDGRFANFVLDWDGRKNLTGSSSFVGGAPWTARAMHALAIAVGVFGAAEYSACFKRGLAGLDEPTPYLDVRAASVLAALGHWRGTALADSRQRSIAWAEEIASSRIGDLLPDLAGSEQIHLWGHLQEAALASAGHAFGRPDLVEAARASAQYALAPAAERRFESNSTLPYEVSSTVAGLQAVAGATGEQHFSVLAEHGRAWFLGGNAAGAPVYDQVRGLVHDGIDNGVLNANSGAESNIEGALALVDTLPWGAYG